MLELSADFFPLCLACYPFKCANPFDSIQAFGWSFHCRVPEVISLLGGGVTFNVDRGVV